LYFFLFFSLFYGGQQRKISKNIQSVRLYWSTVDSRPVEYTNAVVLNSTTEVSNDGDDQSGTAAVSASAKATVTGLSMGTTYHFWAEVVDARGNVSGPLPVGTRTTPTVWEFYVYEQQWYVVRGISMPRACIFTSKIPSILHCSRSAKEIAVRLASRLQNTSR
jgi:hypothetical protein